MSLDSLAGRSLAEFSLMFAKFITKLKRLSCNVNKKKCVFIHMWNKRWLQKFSIHYLRNKVRAKSTSIWLIDSSDIEERNGFLYSRHGMINEVSREERENVRKIMGMSHPPCLRDRVIYLIRKLRCMIDFFMFIEFFFEVAD